MIKIGNYKIDLDTFPNNTLHLSMDYDKINSLIKSIYLIKNLEITWKYENDSELFALICITKWCRENIRCIKNLNLNMPYCPYTRMDRKENSLTDVFTLKYFCEVINSLHFDKVIIFDPHSNVAPALLNNVIVKNPKQEILNTIEVIKNKENYNDSDIVLFFPDEGAMKRYSKLKLNHNFTFGIKTRDWETGNIKNLIICEPNKLNNKIVLIIDDICSKGDTFCWAADKISKYTDKSIYLYVSHLEDTVLKCNIKNQGLITGIYSPNVMFYKEESKKDFDGWNINVC